MTQTARNLDDLDRELMGLQHAIAKAMHSYYRRRGQTRASLENMFSVLLDTTVTVGRNFLDDTAILEATRLAVTCDQATMPKYEGLMQ